MSFSSGHEVLRADYVLNFRDQGLSAATRADKALRDSLTMTTATVSKAGAEAERMSQRQATAWKRTADLATAAQRRIADGQLASQRKIDSAISGTVSRMRKLGAGYDEIAAYLRKYRASAEQTAAAIERSAAREVAAMDRVRSARQRAARSVGLGEGQAIHPLGAARSGAARVGGAARGALAGAGGFLLGGLAGYVGVRGITDAAKQTTDLAKQAAILNQYAGLSRQSALEFAAVTQAYGLSARTLGMTFRTLGTQVDSALTKPTESNTRAFRQLGITQAEVKQHAHDLGGMLGLVADHLNKMPAGAAKTADAAKLLGRNWQALLPMLSQGSQGMKDQLEQAKALGVEMGGNTQENVMKLHEAMIRLKIAQLGMQVQFTEHILPALLKFFQFGMRVYEVVRTHLSPAFHALGQGIHAVSGFLKEHTTLMKALGVAVTAVVAAFVGMKVISLVIGLFRGFGENVRSAVGAVKALASPLDTVKGLFGANQTAEERLMTTNAQLAEANIRLAATYDDLALSARASSEAQMMSGGGGLPGVGGAGGAARTAEQDLAKTRQYGMAGDPAIVAAEAQAARSGGFAGLMGGQSGKSTLLSAVGTGEKAAGAEGTSLLSRAGSLGGGLLKGGLAGGMILIGGNMATGLLSGVAGGKGTTLGGDINAFGKGASAGGAAGATIGSVVPGVGTVLGGAAGAAFGASVGGGIHLIGQGGTAGIAGGALTGAAIGSVVPGFGTALGAGIGAAGSALGLWGPSDQQVRAQKLMKDVQGKINTANGETLQHLQDRLGASMTERGITSKQAQAVQGALTQRGLQLLAPGLQSFGTDLQRAQYAPTEKQLLGGVVNRLQVAGSTRPVGVPVIGSFAPQLSNAQKQGAEMMIKMAAGMEAAGREPRGTTDRLIRDLEKKFGPELTNKLNRDGAFAMQALDSQFRQKRVVNTVQGMVNDMNQKWPFLIPAAKVGMGNYQQVIVNDLGRLRGAIKGAHGAEKQDLINHYNDLKKVAEDGLNAQLEGVQAAQKKNASMITTGGKPILDGARSVWGHYRDEIKSLLGQGAIDQKQAHKLMQQNDAAFRGVINRSGQQLATDAFRNFGHFAGAIAGAAKGAASANKKGVDAIQSATNQILKSLGAAGIPGVKVGGLDAITQGVTGGIVGSDATSTAGQRRTATGGRVPGPVGMDTWTLVDPAGAPAAMVGGGEILVANRHTESRVDSMLGYFGTSLGREVERETVPHYAARGGRFAKGGVASAAASLGQGAAGATVQYVFPFPKNESFSWNRIDQGQDLQGPPGGPVLAIGPGNVSVSSDAFSGFGPFYPVLSLSAGPWAGQSVYYGHTKDTRTGNVNTGDVIGVTQTSANEWTAAPAGWLEFGFTSALGHGNQGQGSAVAPMLHGLAAGHMVAGVGGGGVGGVTVPTLNAPSVSGRGANARAVRTSLKKVTDAANKKLQAAAAAASGPGTTGGSLSVLSGPAPPGALQWEVKAVQETDNLAGNSGGGAYGPLIGYSELGNPLGSGVGNALGHLPGMTMMYISANHKTIQAPLVDIGTGSQGGEWTSFPALVMGLYPKASQALGFALDSSPWLVDIGRVDRGPLHPASGIPVHAFGGRVGAKAGAHGRNRRGHLPLSGTSYHLPERALGGRLRGLQTGGLAGDVSSGGWTFSGGGGRSHRGGSHRGPKPPGTSYHWNPFSGHYEAMTAGQLHALESQWYSGHPGQHFPGGPAKGHGAAPTAYHWDPGKNEYRAMTAAEYRALVAQWYQKHPHQRIPTGPAKVKTSKAAAQSLLDLVSQGQTAFGLGYQRALDPTQGLSWADTVSAAIASATAPGVVSGGYSHLFPDQIVPVNPVPSKVKALLQAADRFVTGHERVKGDDPGFAISRALQAAGLGQGLHHAGFYRRRFGQRGPGRWVSTFGGRGKNAFLSVKGHGYLVPAGMPHGPGWFQREPRGDWGVRHPNSYALGGLVRRRRAPGTVRPGHGHPAGGKRGGRGGGKRGSPVVAAPSAPVVASIGPIVPGYDWSTDPSVGYQVVSDPAQIYGSTVGAPGMVTADLFGTSLDPGLLTSELASLSSGDVGPDHMEGAEAAGGELPILTNPLTQYGDPAAVAAKSLALAHGAQGDISKVLHSHALRRVNSRHHRNRARHEAAQLGRIRGELTDPTNMTSRQLDEATKAVRTDLGQLEHVKHPGKDVKGAIKGLRDSLSKIDYTKGIRDSAKTIDSDSKRIAEGGTTKQITAAFQDLGKTLDNTQKTPWDRLRKLHDALTAQLKKMPSGSAEAKRVSTELALVDAQMGKRTGALVKAAEDQAAEIQKGLTRLQRLMTRQGIDAATGRGAAMLAAYEDQNVKVMENTVASLRKALKLAKQAGDQSAVDDVSTKLSEALDALDQAVTDDVDAHRKAIEAAASDAVTAATHAATLAQSGETALGIQQGLAGTTGTVGAATQTANFIRSQVVPALQGELGALQKQMAAASSVGDTALANQIAEAIAAKQNDISQAQLNALNAIKDATQATAQNIAELGGQLGVSYQSQTLPDFAGMLNGA